MTAGSSGYRGRGSDGPSSPSARGGGGASAAAEEAADPRRAPQNNGRSPIPRPPNHSVLTIFRHRPEERRLDV